MILKNLHVYATRLVVEPLLFIFGMALGRRVVIGDVNYLDFMAPGILFIIVTAAFFSSLAVVTAMGLDNLYQQVAYSFDGTGFSASNKENYAAKRQKQSSKKNQKKTKSECAN